MGILEQIEEDVYSVVETQWDTTCPKLCKIINQTIKRKNTYAKLSHVSNMDKENINSW